MNLPDAFIEIRHFWPCGFPFPLGHGNAATRLSQEFTQPLPPELIYYLDEVAPAQDAAFDTVGNPFRLYGLTSLGQHQPGYNWNPVTQTPIPGWNPDFFLLGDEGGDPVVLDLAQPEAGITQRWHGNGDWEAGDTIADTLGQWLLCTIAQHHALTAFEADVIRDDAEDFCLAPQAAAWYFPRMRRWAGSYYATWCSVFANA
ncbi:hypothetical protein MUN82_05005 [Hymenobacter aerilatus]|uniref:SMI1/KNR4 family protein n=1 Tax=Hymenobacter aerilatus TaxID=2932251 RepID=A0A8T9SX86_9BACT|nr:hypothetical protein [Hymenobacter aerilatus]UOR06455.1 hypothetical protein MUN82_05005 [Hymenobacter aerilatus]